MNSLAESYFIIGVAIAIVKMLKSAMDIDRNCILATDHSVEVLRFAVGDTPK